MLLLTTNSIFQRLAVWHLSHFQFILQPWLQKRRGRGQRHVFHWIVEMQNGTGGGGGGLVSSGSCAATSPDCELGAPGS